MYSAGMAEYMRFMALSFIKYVSKKEREKQIRMPSYGVCKKSYVN